MSQTLNFENYKLTYWFDDHEKSGDLTKHESLFTLRKDYSNLYEPPEWWLMLN